MMVMRTRWPPRPPLRALPALMLFLGTFVSYFMRVSINIAIISMTENATSVCANASSSSASVVSNVTGHETFCWSEGQKSQVKGAFYYGYVLLQVPGGRLAELYGTKRVLGLATFLSALLMLLSPSAAALNVWLLVAVRVMIGLAQGVLFPSINPMLTRWACKEEHSKFYALATMGGTFGTVFIYPLCGMILTWYSWKAVFYTSGAVSLAWCLLWFLLVSDDPTLSSSISDRERDLILSRRVAPPQSSLPIPFRAILTSRAVQVLMLCSFANDWGLYMLLTEGPNFLTNVLKKDIGTVGFLSSLPYLGRFIFAQISGVVSDALISRPHLASKLNVRRAMFAMAFLWPALGLAVMGFLTVHWYYCIAAMTIGFSLNGFNAAAFVNVVDIAPSYPGTVTGVTNGFSAISGFLVPLVAAGITGRDPADPEAWRMVFFTGTAFYVVAVLAFGRFGRAEPQAFNSAAAGQEEEGDVEREPLIA